jgi:hypothetical protein
MKNGMALQKLAGNLSELLLNSETDRFHPEFASTMPSVAIE